MTVLQAQKGPPIKVAEQTIEWLPLAAPSILPFSGTSFVEVEKALRKAFGAFPIRLTRSEHAEILKGMMIGAGDGFEPYRILHDAVERFGEIEVR